MRTALVTGLLLLAAAAPVGADAVLGLELPPLLLTDEGATGTLALRGDRWPARAEVEIRVDGRVAHRAPLTLRPDGGAVLRTLELPALPPLARGVHRVEVRLAGHAAEAEVRVVTGLLSILPPLLAIGLAILFREVLVALVAGIWLGASLIAGDPLTGLLRTGDRYAVDALADGDHASIAIFSLCLGGLIGVIARSGGAMGLASLVTRVATSRRRGNLATWGLGLLIFFDDYSNSLLVGSTMRPITDRLRISREKLAFLVDATAAPVSSFALISSWVGVEVGYIADQYTALGLEGDPYLVFLQTIPYRFYPLLMLWFGLLLVLTQRDFGPMAAAEARAAANGEVSRPGASPASDFEAEELSPPAGSRPRWGLAVFPIVVVIAAAMIGMWATGVTNLAEARAAAEAALRSASSPAEVAAAERQLGLTEPTLAAVVGQANSLKALLWAALLGGLAAIGASVATRVLSLRAAMEAWVAGVRSIALAVIILVLAWSLGAVCQELHTATFVIQALGGWLPASLLPASVFVIAALVSFATGTSWGTMGILFPLVVPLAHQLAPDRPEVVLSAIASILAGSVWGDHCSPISDTTIMSSMASSCDHVDHVRTQLPYALLVGGVSLVVGELATGLGLYGPLVALLVGMALLAVLVRVLGRPVPPPPKTADEEA
jgi:Na+/H+ antiporter NhaC